MSPSKKSRKKKSKQSDKESDDVDIYQNLPEFEEYDVKLGKLKASNESLRSKLEELESKVEALTKTNANLTKVERALSRNISVLFTTALAEVQFKDQMIADLRKERDSLIFRRYHKKDYTGESPSSRQLQLQPLGVPEVVIPTPRPTFEEQRQIHEEVVSKPNPSKSIKLEEVSKQKNDSKVRSTGRLPDSKPKDNSSSRSGSRRQDRDSRSSKNKKQISLSDAIKSEKRSDTSSLNSDITPLASQNHDNQIVKISSPQALTDDKSDIDIGNSLPNNTSTPNADIIPPCDTKKETNLFEDPGLAPLIPEPQKSFRIPKRNNMDESLVVVNTGVLSNPGFLDEKLNDVCKPRRYDTKPPQKDEDAGGTEEANTSVDASLSSSTECAFSIKRKNRIKILCVSREEDSDVEEVAVVIHTSKRKHSFNSNDEPLSKILCSDFNPELVIKTEDDAEVQGDNFLSDHDIKTKDDAEVQDNKFLSKHDIKNKNDVLIEFQGNKCSVEDSRRSGRRQSPCNSKKPESWRHDEDSRSRERVSGSRKDESNRRRHNRERPRERENERRGDSKRRSRDVRYHSQSSRSPSKHSDSDRSHSRHSRDQRRSKSSEGGRMSTSPAIKENEEVNPEHVNHLENNNRRSTVSPENDNCLKTTLSDNFFSEDEENLARKYQKRIKTTDSISRKSHSSSRRRDEDYRRNEDYRSSRRRDSPIRNSRRYRENVASNHKPSSSTTDLREKLKEHHSKSRMDDRRADSGTCRVRERCAIVESNDEGETTKITIVRKPRKHNLQLHNSSDFPSENIEKEKEDIEQVKEKKNVEDLEDGEISDSD